jgi:ubiquinone/menaquinone biosynthesis C-methylase UbiE
LNWEETIIQARENPEFAEVIEQSYLGADLIQNVERFRHSEEFSETIRTIENYFGKKKLRILDLGSGNGISTISLALLGHNVTSIEPDPSETVGRGAIRKLCDHYQIDIDVLEGFGENTSMKNDYFDVVYTRQVVHHAADLMAFIRECYRVSKTDGILFTVRDHVIYNSKDKNWFLESHPFHRYYGGENAYLLGQYKQAFTSAGFHIDKIFKYYESVINYSPMTREEHHKFPETTSNAINDKLKRKLGILGGSKILKLMFRILKGYYPSFYNEKMIAGRVYSFIAVKK